MESVPEMAFAGAVKTSPASSAKLIRKSPNRFAGSKILTSLIYVRHFEELTHLNPRTAQ
jgi:hypothetical protein